jgi:probable rRNA maturation factor
MAKESGIEILNLQQIKKINLKELRLDVKKILTAIDLSDKKVSLVFCDNLFIVKLNKKTFGLKNPTDVISFPLSEGFSRDYLGEVVVSVEEAVNAAEDYGNTWKKELLLYVIHGILHLTGYDDLTGPKKTKMDNKQDEILAQLTSRVK